ncbi:glyoxalase family protein [Klebsiella michiganensis]|nr:glyoxalase family protein [Klebsiella michiganensis]
MEYDLDGMDVLFVAGFGPITQSTPGQQGVLCGCAWPAAKTDAR